MVQSRSCASTKGVNTTASSCVAFDYEIGRALPLANAGKVHKGWFTLWP